MNAIMLLHIVTQPITITLRCYLNVNRKLYTLLCPKKRSDKQKKSENKKIYTEIKINIEYSRAERAVYKMKIKAEIIRYSQLETGEKKKKHSS